MRPSLKAFLITFAVIVSLAGSALAQAGRNRQQNAEPKKKAERPQNAPTDEQKKEGPKEEEPEQTEPINGQQDVETVRVDTNLVTVPVIISDRGDRYIPDLKQEEFTIYEDGVKQEISFFETVTAPFNVVLMLDTSASAQEKLGQIQQAAIAFTELLQRDDRVKVISFDDRVHDLSDFTSDRAVLQWAIRGTRSGQGTKLYDAMAVAIRALQRLKGRKAIVIFTDGIDSFSDHETIDKNRRMIEEAGIIIYPIRYDTRDELERMFRQQQQSGQVIDLATILGGRPGTTPTTFPGGTTVPSRPTGGGGGGGGGGVGTSLPRLPGGVILSREKRRSDDPSNTDPKNPRSDPTSPSRTPGPSGNPDPSGRPSSNDPIKAELDMLYSIADDYLNDLADKSGGRLHRADTLSSLPLAFKQIAAELRTQYSLGYYPPKPEPGGKYRKIKVATTRKGAVVRARPGYRTPGVGKK